MVSKLALSFFIGSSSNLLVTRPGIRSRLSSNSGQISHFGVTCPWTPKHPYILTLSNMNMSKISWPVLIKFYMYYRCSGGKAALCIGADWTTTAVVMASKSSYWLIMEKMVCPPFLSHFDAIFANLACIQDRRKISDEFEFQPVWIIYYTPVSTGKNSHRL